MKNIIPGDWNVVVNNICRSGGCTYEQAMEMYIEQQTSVHSYPLRVELTYKDKTVSTYTV